MLTLKKSLGQHFLKNDFYVQKIVEALDETKPERLLEVGPGAGALTKQLIRMPGIDFKASELDEEKIAFLFRKYPELSGKIISGDFLQISPPFPGSFTVIGNFPYNISSQILFKILEWKEQVPLVIGMFQKEVAERAAANPGSKTYGVLSALIQPYYAIEYLFDVPPEAFEPPPKIVSAVIRLKRKTDSLNYRSEKAYKILVKAAFNQRRKMLRNAVRSIFPPEILVDKIFDKRAEQLSIDDFAALTFKMNS